MADIPPSTSMKVRIVSFVRAFWLAHGVGPTLREIALQLGSSKPTVTRHVDELVIAGRLGREKGRARAIWVPGEPEAAAAMLRGLGWNVNPPKPRFGTE